MKNNLFFLSVFALAAFCSCEKWAGDPITQNFSIDGSYTCLVVEDALDVTVSDTASQITVTAGENVMPKVKIEIKDNTLKIYLRRWWNSNHGSEMKVIIPYNPDLKTVRLSGASEFNSEYGMESQAVEVRLSGASDFFCDINADDIKLELSGSSSLVGNINSSNSTASQLVTTLDIDLSGSSDVTLTGQVSTLKVDLSGSSDIKMKMAEDHYSLVCDQCTGSLSGSSDAYIHSDGSICVSLSGSSSLHYTGSAVTRGSSTSGSSNIVHDGR